MKFYHLFAIALFFTGCYRFPNEGECSTVPATNNPSITKERSSGMMPGFKM